MFSMLTHTDLDCFRRGVAPASEDFGNWSVSVFASWRPAARSSTSACIPVSSTRSPNDYPMTVCDCILPAAKPGGWHRPRSPATPSGTGPACTMSLEHLLTVVLHADTSLNAVLDGGRRAPRGPGCATIPAARTPSGHGVDGGYEVARPPPAGPSRPAGGGRRSARRPGPGRHPRGRSHSATVQPHAATPARLGKVGGIPPGAG